MFTKQASHELRRLQEERRAEISFEHFLTALRVEFSRHRDYSMSRTCNLNGQITIHRDRACKDGLSGTAIYIQNERR